MFHGLNNELLYTAHKICVEFFDDIGNKKLLLGSCFFVKNKAGNTFLITNRHILDYGYKKNKDSDLYMIKKIVITGKSESLKDIEFEIISPRVIYPSSPENDVACIKMTGESQTIAYYVPYELLATKDKISECISICDFLAFPGFPEWHDKRSNRPILRTGTISSDPRFSYFHSNKQGDSIVDGECIAYEAFSYSGSSGSPVFATQKGLLATNGLSSNSFREALCIGVNAGHLPISEPRILHSGISYFYKSSEVINLIDNSD